MNDTCGTAPIKEAAPRLVERRHLIPFALVTSLFFSWALAAALNDVLIRQFQKALDLTRGQAGLIQFAFYFGYFCAALPAGLLMQWVGYKKGILIGLTLYACGAFLFYPAAEIRVYAFFLTALYIVAIGLAFLETAANPYVTALGDPRTGAGRLNLAQSFYGIGAIIGPVIGGLFIFSGVEMSAEQLAALSPSEIEAYRSSEALAVQVPYLGVGAVVTLIAILIHATPFPSIEAERQLGSVHPIGSIVSVLRYRHVVFAIVAQFFYVGAQVGIWSFFIDFTKEAHSAIPETVTAFMLSGSLAALMVGRFTGAFLMTRLAPNRMLAAYAVANIVLCAAAVFGSGWFAIGALWLTSFFMSIMFPTIFALGVSGLGAETKIASSFLIMSIVGGALVPPAMGYMADWVGTLRLAMMIPMLCFAVVLWFAVSGYKDRSALS